MIPSKWIIIAVVALGVSAGAVFAVKTYKDAIAEQERLTGELLAANAATEQTKTALAEVSDEYGKLATLAQQRKAEAHRARIVAERARRELRSMLDTAGASGDFAAINKRLCRALEGIQGAEFSGDREACIATGSPGDGAGAPFSILTKQDTEALITNIELAARYIERVEADYGNHPGSTDK